jgi:hypothetical protein
MFLPHTLHLQHRRRRVIDAACAVPAPKGRRRPHSASLTEWMFNALHWDVISEVAEWLTG